MEYLVGYCVGISQTIIGYPFDTIKTRLQTNSVKIGKPKSIWMGIRYPLINSTLINTITFGNRDYFIRKTDNYVLSYTLVGLINGVVQNQLDNAKVKSQVTGETAKLPRKFVLNGMKYSVLLETISMPIYFLTFDYLHKEKKINSFQSGGMAGINSWFWLYPIDTLKSRSYLNPGKSLRELIKLEKTSLYRGLSFALLRAYLVNGVAFSVYTFLSDYSRSI